MRADKYLALRGNPEDMSLLLQKRESECWIVCGDNKDSRRHTAAGRLPFIRAQALAREPTRLVSDGLFDTEISR